MIEMAKKRSPSLTIEDIWYYYKLPILGGSAILILVIYVKLGWGVSPDGRLDVGVSPPTRITGAYTIDALVTGNWLALKSAFEHLALPVATLTITTIGPILKMTRSTMQQMLASDFTRYARLCGLPRHQWHASAG